MPFSLREADDEDGFSFKPLLLTFKRFWWIMVLALGLGVAAGFVAFRMVPLEYVAEGAIWITAPNQDQGYPQPITQGGLLEAAAWPELLTSYQVLDPVVRQERLYLSYPSRDSLAFADFTMRRSFRPGDYELVVGRDGSSFELFAEDGSLVDEGRLGSPVGEGLGFVWTPPEGAFEPEAEVSFEVVTPRDAARSLGASLSTRLDRQANFLRLRLEGKKPERIARVLNAVMERHVAVAADLKRAKLDELTLLLEEQLDTAEANLKAAEEALTGYQVATATLPSEETSPIVPGLEQTTNTVYNEFFNLRLQQEELRSDRERLEEALRRAEAGEVRVASFELIPAVQASSELQQALAELTQVRAELRVLREDYTDEYAPVADLIRRENTLKTATVPTLAQVLIQELRTREQALADRLASRESELTEIPPRAGEERRRQRAYQIANDLYIQLERGFETARLAAASSIPDVRILDEAVVPRVPSNDGRFQVAGMAFLVPLGLGAVLILLLHRLDPKLRDPAQIGGDIGLNWLGTIPRYRQGMRGRDNAEEIREAFRDLRMKVDFAVGAARPLVLSVTSPSEGEGKTFVSANLATAFADLGRKTILVDGDTRRGDLHKILGMNRKPGLTDFLMNGQNHQVIQNTENPKLHFIGFGSRTPSSPELLTSSQMQSLLAGLKRRYEVIILDSPPMAAGSDAFVIGAHSGNVLMVLRSGSTNKDLASAQIESFLHLPVRILGAVLNDFVAQIGQGYYRYYSRYLPGYEATDEREEEPEVAGELT
jgi:capsular exopolysaccharide synthesis family protein